MSQPPQLTTIDQSEVGRPAPLDVERAVVERYSAAAREREPQLCCPVNYDGGYLEALPPELIERDYGCGDPSRHLSEGETVLDLGSGGGKIRYIAAQVVGAAGRVIGIDMNDEMLALARKHQPAISKTLGFDVTEFRKGRIQDLALDLEAFEAHLADHPVRSAADWVRAEAHAREMRRASPMVADHSVDAVISNCVLNLVSEADRIQLFGETHRVLRRGGRVVISDIVSDEVVPERLKRDPKLWSGCISGAFTEKGLLDAFSDAGFYGIELLERQAEPWALVDGIEFRSVTVRAYKGKDGPCLDQKQAVIYRGPWKSVTDDDGHVLRRGERAAVCGKTYAIYTNPPYAGQVEGVPPHADVPLDEAPAYDCRTGAVRDPRETKGIDYHPTQLPEGDCCGPGGCC